MVKIVLDEKSGKVNRLKSTTLIKNKQDVALTGRNSTGPPCSRGAIIRLEAA